MVRQRRCHSLLLLVAFACLVLTVSAKGGGGGHGSGSSGSHSSGTGTDVDSTSSGSGSTSDSSSGSASGSGSTGAKANDVDYTYHSGTSSGGAFWPGGPAYRPGGSANNGTSSGSGSGSGAGFGGGSSSSGAYRGGSGGGRNGAGAGFDIDKALYYRTIHGILAAVAFVILFPIGSILMRVVPGRFAVWVHAVFQVLAWGVYVAAAALGIYLVRVVQIPGGGLLQNPSTRYHPIIGLVLLALLIIQPIVGFVHHRVYKKVQKRQVWSYVHLTIGRVGITLGIVNGGLGLYLSNASDYYKRAYAIVAAIMWALWMAVAIWAEIRRLRKGRTAKYEAVAKAPAGETRASQE